MGRFGMGRGTVGDFRDGLGDPRVGSGRDKGPSGKPETCVETLG